MRIPFLQPAACAPTIRAMSSDWSRPAAAIHGAFFARPWSAHEIEDLLRQPGALADVATDGPAKILLGFAISRVVEPEAELLTIAVDRRRQRSGVGKALLSTHLSRLASRRAEHVFLEVDEGNKPALELYRRFGFRQVGARPGYYVGRNGERATALVLRADLC